MNADPFHLGLLLLVGCEQGPRTRERRLDETADCVGKLPDLPLRRRVHAQGEEGQPFPQVR